MSIISLINILPNEYKLKVADARPEIFDWNKISAECKLPESFIEKHKDRVNWYFIFTTQKLSEQFIVKHKNLVNWTAISKYQKLSESFIEKHDDDVN